MTVVPLVAEDDIRVHITTDDIASARDAWLESIAEGDPVEQVIERYEMWRRLPGVRAQQILDDLRMSGTDIRSPRRQLKGLDVHLAQAYPTDDERDAPT